LGKLIFDVFLCPDSGCLWPGETAVKAERSEFILSLDGRRASHSKTFRVKENIKYAPFLICLTAVPSLMLSSPFHPHSG
jgi:hypothetical protein